MSGLIAELSLHCTWYTTCFTCRAPNVLYVISTRLRPGHLSIHVGDGSLCSEEIVKSRFAPFNAINNIIIYYY